VRPFGPQQLYYPASAVFKDLFESSKIETKRPFDMEADRHWIDAYLDLATGLVRAYSNRLADDFDDAVSTIILLASNSEFHSGNFGLKYYGSVFISPYNHNECSGAAALVHEYVHLCNWLLWCYVEPEGRPGDAIFARSPITGNQVDAFSLCDAMMIYASNCDFYGWTVECSDAPRHLKDWAIGRYRELVRNMPSLYHMLIAIVAPGTRYRRYLEHSMQCFDSSLKLYGSM
jgi:hypothetical protein